MKGDDEETGKTPFRCANRVISLQFSIDDKLERSSDKPLSRTGNVTDSICVERIADAWYRLFLYGEPRVSAN